MKSSSGIIVGLFFLGTLSGCISMTGYVDPQLKSVSYKDLSTTQKGPELGVFVEFQRSGQPFTPVTEQARETVLRVLNKANVFSSVKRGVFSIKTEARLKVVINNTRGKTKGSPVATGVTFGAIGTGTIDPYLISAAYEHADSQPITKEYQHAIHSTIGSASAPEGLKPMTISDAFDAVVEQVILLLLFDLQQAGKL